MAHFGGISGSDVGFATMIPRKSLAKSFNFGVKKSKASALEDGGDKKKSSPSLDDSQEPPRKMFKLDHSNRDGNGDETREGEDEDDPLEAFMANVGSQLKREEEGPKKEVLRRDDIEEEDNVESYINAMKQKGIGVGRTARPIEEDENANSDDEVYATAKAVDAALAAEDDSDDNAPDLANPSVVKKDVEPLTRVDHSIIDYPEVEKYFYDEHPEISALTPEQVSQLRRTWDMHVSGAGVAKPIESFVHFNFSAELMREIQRNGYTSPTPIQKQAVPVALEGRDIIGIAKTGSGKTAAFVWPMLIHIMDQPELEKGDGPIGLILAPTRELVSQIYTESRKFAKGYSLKVSAVYGGASKMEQFKELRGGGPSASGPEIIVATPGRLIDMIKMKATNLRRISFLVLDEADRMFDLGFEAQVRSVCDNIRPDRQTLLFSATFPPRIEKLAREVTSDPIRITVGTVGQANEDVTQVAVVMRDDSFKWDWLVSRLAGFAELGSVLVFVARIGGVDELAKNVRESGFSCEALHGEMMQMEREKVLRDYRHNKFKILVATDVASRGLDIKTVRTVINYDVARDIDSHTHRIGRTGRAGEKGTAYTLITEKEDRFAGELVRNLEGSGQIIPHELLDIAMRNNRFRKSREGWRAEGGRGRGRGRGRGGGREGFAVTSRGRGRGVSVGSSANSLPLKLDRTGIGAHSYEGTSSSRGNTGYGMMTFQKASTSQGGAAGLQSVESSGDSGSSTGIGTQRGDEPKKRRWDVGK